MGLLAGLASLAQPILARILISLGMSVVTVTGVVIVIDNLKQQIVTNLQSAPAVALQLAGLAGIPEALGIMFAAFTFCVSYWGATRAVQVAGAA